jgi:TATA-binding protein-associated factor Taf7
LPRAKSGPTHRKKACDSAEALHSGAFTAAGAAGDEDEDEDEEDDEDEDEDEEDDEEDDDATETAGTLLVAMIKNFSTPLTYPF